MDPLKPQCWSSAPRPPPLGLSPGLHVLLAEAWPRSHGLATVPLPGHSWRLLPFLLTLSPEGPHHLDINTIYTLPRYQTALPLLLTPPRHSSHQVGFSSHHHLGPPAQPRFLICPGRPFSRRFLKRIIPLLRAVSTGVFCFILPSLFMLVDTNSDGVSSSHNVNLVFYYLRG